MRIDSPSLGSDGVKLGCQTPYPLRTVQVIPPDELAQVQVPQGRQSGRHAVRVPAAQRRPAQPFDAEPGEAPLTARQVCHHRRCEWFMVHRQTRSSHRVPDNLEADLERKKSKA